MSFEDSFDDVGGGVARLERHREHLAPGGFDLFAARDEMSPVGAFNQDIGEQPGNEFAGRLFIEQCDRVHGFERQRHFGALVLCDEWARRSFHTAHAGIGIEPENQHIPERTGLFEKTDVAGMQQVVTSVGEDDPPAFTLPLGTFGDQFDPIVEAAHAE